MDARQLLLDNQRWIHSSVVTPKGWEWKIEDSVCEGLTDAQLRHCPQAHLNSIAWLLWHMARCEDVAVNCVLRGVPEVLDAEAWLPRLGITTRHIGTEDTYEEVQHLSAQVDLAALRAYRARVGQVTRAWVGTVDFATLEGVVSGADVQRAREHGAASARAAWVFEYWESDAPRSTFLSWLTVGHNFFHLGEAWVLRGLLVGHVAR